MSTKYSYMIFINTNKNKIIMNYINSSLYKIKNNLKIEIKIKSKYF